MYMISSILLLLFNVNYMKSWIYSNLMEIGFYSNKRKIEKNNCKIYDLNFRHSIWSTSATFNVLKVSQSRAIFDRFCREEGFELTYYIETLRDIKIPSQTYFLYNLSFMRTIDINRHMHIIKVNWPGKNPSTFI